MFENRMKIDIAAAREVFRDRGISDIGLVRSSHRFGDRLTIQMSQAVLFSVLKSGELSLKSEQWIIRD